MPDCSTLLSLTPLPVVLRLKLNVLFCVCGNSTWRKAFDPWPRQLVPLPVSHGPARSALTRIRLCHSDTLTDGSICSDETGCGAVARDIQTSAYPTDAFAGSPRGVRSRTFAYVHRMRAAALTRRGVCSEGGAGGCGATGRHGFERGRRRTRRFGRRGRGRHGVRRRLPGGARGGGAGVGRAGQGPIESLVSLSSGRRVAVLPAYS